LTDACRAAEYENSVDIEWGHMNSEASALFFVLVLCLGMLACFYIGRRVGTREAAKQAGKVGLGAIEAAIFALLGLLIAFTFSGAASRFEERRHLIIEEANDIGTAYLRIELLPAETQPEIRELFRKYVDARLSIYRHLYDVGTASAEIARSQELQSEIWTKSVAATKRSDSAIASPLLLPALNSMFDITTVRTAATEDHPPIEIFLMLALIALASAGIAGYQLVGAQHPGTKHIIGYVLILSISIDVILDLEFPRLGVIRIDRFDHYLVDVRSTIK
jgi:hypothetical protein